jgi:ssRNA-specific RNase YbeY (16S rRNA maturation enzyme)
MQSTNLESRGIAAPTDILSFPFHGAIRPGTLEDVPFDIPDYYMLVSS